MDNNKPIRVRFAPSPSGYLHLGGARTALFNYLFAKKRNGKFILRIEDTDLSRSSDDSIKTILTSLSWLGLSWDEGVDLDLNSFGPHGEYRQSKRLEIYKKYALDFIDKGLAYYDFSTDDCDTMSSDRSLPIDIAKARVDAGESATIRFKAPTNVDITFYDEILGKNTVNSDTLKDFVILRSNGMPMYNFACVIDDYLMEISHVIRANEHLSNTPKQILIYKALGVKPPTYAHASLIMRINDLGEKVKLSKRDGAVGVEEFKDGGYLPEALINFLALLGWSSPKTNQEIISLKEMTELFSLKRINPAPAVFDQAKLDWMNGYYIRNTNDHSLWNLIKSDLNGFLIPVDNNFIEKSLSLFKISSSTLKDLKKHFELLKSAFPTIDKEGADVLKWDNSSLVLKAFREEILKLNKPSLESSDLDLITKNITLSTGVKGKELFWPFRVALIGSAHGPELKTFVSLITSQEIINRIDNVI